jgi:pentose-5-phosphate-3-epimerase
MNINIVKMAEMKGTMRYFLILKVNMIEIIHNDVIDNSFVGNNLVIEGIDELINPYL